MKILLIDDDDLLRKMLHISMTKVGHSVIEARNGRDALEICRVEPPDLVVTDVVMPEKEGIETIGDLRRLYPTLPVIAISGGGRNSAADYLKIARHMGAVAVLQKPFSIEDLAALVASVANRKGGP